MAMRAWPRFATACSAASTSLSAARHASAAESGSTMYSILSLDAMGKTSAPSTLAGSPQSATHPIQILIDGIRACACDSLSKICAILQLNYARCASEYQLRQIVAKEALHIIALGRR